MTALSTMDDRRPICLLFTGNGWTHAWLSRTAGPEVVDRVLVALAEVGLTPDLVDMPRAGRDGPESKPFLRYDRTLKLDDRDMIEKAVRLARMPMAHGGRLSAARVTAQLTGARSHPPLPGLEWRRLGAAGRADRAGRP